jgi:predicted RNA methylase
VLHYGNIRNASISISKLFCEMVAFDEQDPANQQDIALETGTAIAPRWAASCLVDYMRTRKFILGIRDAIEERLKMNPGKPVIVMYAGTGPFASLLTPLITIFTPAQLQMVLMEINPVSFQYLQKITGHFGMKDYIIEQLQTDSVTYSIPKNQQPDIIVSETMNNALQKEPQVSIAANLVSQSNRNPVLIPELIKVDACILGDTEKKPDAIFYLKTLIELNAETAVEIKNKPEKIPVLSTGIVVTITEFSNDQYKCLALCTSIRIFREHGLGFNESGLTVPQILRMTDTFKNYPVRLLFKYQIESNPGFRITNV